MTESPVTAELPKYKSHKEVWALKIKDVRYHVTDAASPTGKGGWVLEFEPTIGLQYAALNVEEGWIRKHEPTKGGYYVVYEGGYTSFSPADAFESGYTLIS